MLYCIRVRKNIEIMVKKVVMKIMTKKRLLMCILSTMLLCGCTSEATESMNSVSENVSSSSVAGIDSGDEGKTMMDYAPESFVVTIFEINGHMIPAISNDRYYIFTAPESIGSLVEGEQYIFEKYDQLAIRYNPDFMCGSGVMEDIEARGEYHQGIKDLKMISADISSLSVPEGFEISELKDGDSKYYVWSDGRYYIFRAICNEYEDWYILDTTDKMYIRYEPSFMAGK